MRKRSDWFASRLGHVPHSSLGRLDHRSGWLRVVNLSLCCKPRFVDILCVKPYVRAPNRFSTFTLDYGYEVSAIHCSSPLRHALLLTLISTDLAHGPT